MNRYFQLLNILLAARDTTAALLTFTIYILCLHPQVATKLRREVVERVPSAPPSFEDIRQMKYCEQFKQVSVRTTHNPDPPSLNISTCRP